MKINYAGWECDVEKTGYYDGANALVLKDGEEVVTVASVNIMEELEFDEVAIKNYSENEGILEVLVANKIVSEPVRTTTSGFVEIPICKILI